MDDSTGPIGLLPPGGEHATVDLVIEKWLETAAKYRSASEDLRMDDISAAAFEEAAEDIEEFAADLRAAIKASE